MSQVHNASSMGSRVTIARKLTPSDGTLDDGGDQSQTAGPEFGANGRPVGILAAESHRLGERLADRRTQVPGDGAQERI